MKRIIEILTVIVLSLVLSYLATSFIQAEFNPFIWNKKLRLSIIFYSTSISVLYYTWTKKM